MIDLFYYIKKNIILSPLLKRWLKYLIIFLVLEEVSMRIDNYKSFLKFLDNLNYRPKLLLHACCAPCSSHCIKLLEKYFDITIYYSNDNIYPEKEFYYRLDEINRN